jgi:hypothetical protein
MDSSPTTSGGGCTDRRDVPSAATAPDAASDADPPTDHRYVATFPGAGEEGTVTLVGVVHDHPASITRVRRAVTAVAPAVVALELPPLAVPLYEAHAAGDGRPSLGGEFSAAADAAATDDVVGIDGPSPGFVGAFLRRLYRDGPSPAVVGRSLRSLASASARAATCRVAAWVTSNTSLRVGVGSVTPHETSASDPHSEQVADERAVIQSAVSIRRALETSSSSRHRSEAREAHMAERLSTARERGDVVAVVGAGHFDPLADALASSDARS